MAENDIYGSKDIYEKFLDNLSELLVEPSKRSGRRGCNGKYWCKHSGNLQYFLKLDSYLAAKDLSFVRRIRVFKSLLLLCHVLEKDLAECGKDDLNKAMAFMHGVYKSPQSKETFIKTTKYIWKILFPETDEKGRQDETIVPYAVRHLSAKIDRSRQKMRKDKLKWEEFEQIVDYFSNDPRIQAYLTLSLESLARPQELLYVRIRNVELFENYAKVFISEHGKEGIGLLQCIDSYPYLLKWLGVHPAKNSPESFLFVNTGNTNTLRQLKPTNINKMIKKACKDLGINKPITCYSLKRNGVTMRRLRGESDMEIQHAARWTSTKQLKTYDLSSQDEAMKLALEKRGIITTSLKKAEQQKAKECPFCKESVGFSETVCPKCKHALNYKAVKLEQKKDEEIFKLRETITEMQASYEKIKEQIMMELVQTIQQNKNAQVT